MRLLVTGADGLLGSAVVRAARERGHEVTACVRTAVASHAGEVSRLALDITDEARVREVLLETAPDAVLHCAAYTHVDGAEAHREEALEVNVLGAGRVARAAAEVDSLVLLPSSDYVFDGTASRPYRPGDPPNPINLYGKSKWMGEEEVRMSGAPWLVVRTSWLYGSGGGNFVDGILDAARTSDRLRIVSDQRGRPTWTGSLAPALLDLVAIELGEVAGGDGEGAAIAHPHEGRSPVPAATPGRTLHLADRGEATWHDLAAEALHLAGIEAELIPVTTEEWGAPAPRPRYSVLDVQMAEAALGYRMPEWRQSLRRYLSGEEGMKGELP